MFELPFNRPWAAALLAGLVWTTLFSLAERPLRGLRNLGILASYALGLAMALRAPWRAALAVWTVFALAGGLAYAAYEAWMRSRHADADAKPRSGALLLSGWLAWPIMLPEVAEYWLAEVGVLRPPRPAPVAHGDQAPPAGAVQPTE